MRDIPADERPALVISHGERNSYGYCMKTVLSVSKIAGTGYKAAAVFAHELQHQYQFVFGNAQRFAHAFSLKESVLEERIGEAAAETAAYQYLYDVRDNNPQARAAYRNALKKQRHAGLRRGAGQRRIRTRLRIGGHARLRGQLESGANLRKKLPPRNRVGRLHRFFTFDERRQTGAERLYADLCGNAAGRQHAGRMGRAENPHGRHDDGGL